MPPEVQRPHGDGHESAEGIEYGVSDVAVALNQSVDDFDLQGADVELSAFLRLQGVHRPHAIDVVPDFIRPASRRDDHEGGGELAVMVELFRHGDVLFVVVDAFPAVLSIDALQVADGEAQDFFLRQEAVAA